MVSTFSSRRPGHPGLRSRGAAGTDRLARIRFAPLLLSLWLAGSLLSGLAFLIVPGALAPDVEVRLVLSDPAAPEAVELRYGSPLAGSRRVAPAVGSRGTEFVWKVSGAWVRDLELAMRPEVRAELRYVGVRAGGTTSEWDARGFGLRWRETTEYGPDGATRRALAPVSIRLNDSGFSFGHAVLNWAGDPVMLSAAVVHPLPYALAGTLLLWGWGLRTAGRPHVLPATEEPVRPEGARRRAWGFASLAGLAGLAGAVAMLEASSPYYFTQDDNLAQFLPVILGACASASTGMLATWSPDILLGAPLLDNGTYGISYPPTYLSCAAAAATGIPRAALDFHIVMHQFLGFWGMLLLLRRVGADPWIAAFAATAFALNGFVLISGKSWYYMAPYLAALPWMVLLGESLLREGARLRTVMALGLVTGFAYHAGNVQMWIYMLLLCGLAFVLRCFGSRRPVRALAGYAAAMLIGLAVAAPVLYPQFEFATGIVREVPTGRSMRFADLATLALPWPVTPGPPAFGTINWAKSGEVFHLSPLLTAGWLLALFGALAAARPWRSSLAAGAWAATALVAAVFALGPAGGLWSLMARLPMFSGFQHPFKFVLFIHFFAALSGAVAISRLLDAGPDRRFRMAVPVIGAAVLAWHVSVSDASHYQYPGRPAHALSPHPPAAAADSARIHTVAPRRSQFPAYADSLPQNWPLLAGVRSTGGYDPLVEASRPNLLWSALFRTMPVDTLAAYGVRMVLVDETATAGIYGPNPGFWSLETLTGAEAEIRDRLLGDGRLRPTARTASVQAYRIEEAAPLAFDQAGAALAIRADWQGVSVDVSGVEPGKVVTVGFLARPAFTASLDGSPVPVAADHWGRLRVQLPAGGGTLRLSYVPDWRTGALLGALLAGLGLALAAAARMRGGPTDASPLKQEYPA